MRRRDERGLAVSVEAAILAPVLLLFVGLLMTLARVALADQQLGASVAAGARAASLERTQGRAAAAAGEAVERGLSQSGVVCLETSIRVEASGVGRALGERAMVHVRVSCRVALSDVALPFIPGSVAVSQERSSPVDPLRGR